MLANKVAKKPDQVIRGLLTDSSSQSHTILCLAIFHIGRLSVNLCRKVVKDKRKEIPTGFLYSETNGLHFVV